MDRLRVMIVSSAFTWAWTGINAALIWTAAVMDTLKMFLLLFYMVFFGFFLGGGEVVGFFKIVFVGFFPFLIFFPFFVLISFCWRSRWYNYCLFFGDRNHVTHFVLHLVKQVNQWPTFCMLSNKRLQCLEGYFPQLIYVAKQRFYSRLCRYWKVFNTIDIEQKKYRDQTAVSKFGGCRYSEVSQLGGSTVLYTFK